MTVETFIISTEESREETLERLLSAFEAINQSSGLGFYMGDEAVTQTSITVPFLSQTEPPIGVEADFDTNFDFTTLSFASRDGSRPDAVIADLERRIGFATDDQLLAELYRNTTPRALLRFSRGYRSAESERAAAPVRTALSHPDPKTRQIAAMAILNLGWSSLREELKTAVQREPDPTVRTYMETALEGFSIDE